MGVQHLLFNLNSRAARGERGAALVELALTLPIFLAGLLFFIWLGISFNATNSLKSAVPRAIRLAATRGPDDLLGTRIIGDVHAWRADQNDEGRMPTLLSLPSEHWGTALKRYDESVAAVFGSSWTLRDLPPEYTYALIYVNEAMRQSVGATLRFPCDADDPVDGAGCLECEFLNPDSLKPASQMLKDGDSPYDIDPPRRSIGLECRYQPQTAVVTPLVRLLSLLAGKTMASTIVFSHKQFMDFPEYSIR